MANPWDDLEAQYQAGSDSTNPPWAQFESAYQASKPEATISAAPEPSMFDALSQFFDHVKGSVPFSDEALGAAHAISQYPFSDKDFSALYTEGKNNELLKRQNYAQQHNVAASIANLIGGMAAFGPVGAEGSIPTLASTPLRAAGQGVKAAATIGGISGFSSGSGFIDRLEKGGLGAITAAPFGAITGGVAGTGNKVANSIKDDIANVAQVKALQEGLGADALAANEAAAGRFDPNMNIDAALNAASKVSQAKEAQLLAERAAKAKADFDAAYQVQTPFSEVIRTENTGLFDPRGAPLTKQVTEQIPGTPGLNELLDLPYTKSIVKEALGRDRDLATKSTSDPEMLQTILADLTASQRSPTVAPSINKLKSDLVSEVTPINPQLIKARGSYAENSQPLDAFEASRQANLANLSPKNIGATAKNLFNGMSPREISNLKNDFLTQNAETEWNDLIKASVVQKLLSQKDNVTVAEALMGTAANRNILKAALPDAEYLFLDRAYKTARASNAANAFKAQTTTALGGATSWLNALTQSLPFTGRLAAKLILAAPKIALSTIPRQNTAPELALGLLSGYSQQPKLEGP